jgi:putative tryptophan/tyrosine transport system substrate-binding protein
LDHRILGDVMPIRPIKRREFIAGLSGAAAWPVIAQAKQGGKVYRLGILGVAPERNWDELLQGLQDLGYIDGQNLIVERRYSEGHAERWFDLANELIGQKVDVIVVNTTPAALAAKKATSTIPIVFPTAFDPVGAGLADSLARPGGNVTGLGLLVPEVTAKGLALLKEAVPSLSKVSVLWNAANQANTLVWRDVEATARALGLTLHSQPVHEPKDLEAAFAAITQEHPDGLLVLSDALLYQYKSQIADFTDRKKLPAVFPFRQFAELGGLMAYGPNLANMFRVGANYVDKTLKGAKPADLPIEQPTKFDFVINLKTAKTFGLEIPSSLLARADEVIE